jgi:signal transduction histidine kinase
MSVQRAPTKTAKRSSALDSRFGHWLAFARGTWIILVVLTLTIFFVSLPTYITQLQTLCVDSVCGYQQLSPGHVGSLKGIGLTTGDYTAFIVVLTSTSVILCLVVSVLIVWRRSDDRMALLVALMLVAFGPVNATITVAESSSSWQVPNEFLTFITLSLFVLVFLLFPTGQFVPRWTRWATVVCLAGVALSAFFPMQPYGYIGQFVMIGVLPILAYIQFYRYRHVSSPVQRQQTKWVVFGLVVPIMVFVSWTLLALIVPALSDPHSLYQVVFYAVLACMPLSIPLTFGFAMLRYRLWDIDLIINRTLVYGALTLSVIGLYVLVVVGLGTLTQIQGNVLLSLLATGVIAVLFQPLRSRLQRGVNHLMYGERDDPYAVLTHLGSRLEATLVPEKVLPTIVETLAQALKLPYVAIALLPDQHPVTRTAAGTAGAMAVSGTQEADIVASYGAPTADPIRVPLVYQAETIGYLLLAARAGDTFVKADTRLLADLARQAGVAVYAVRLTTHLRHLTMSLQESREHLVTTREEERRRLRRDLHDGLGPTLASLTFKVDAARNVLVQDSARADTLLDSVRQLAQEAISDIRRLVYNLRPPALDELGLLSALHEQVALYQHQGLEVVFDTPETLPPLPAAVEVAAYRIAQEALANVARHARAQHCLLLLALDAETLHLDISDDGQGIPAGHRIGVGLHAMHERASELGGSCTITAGSPGGTIIRVNLPLTEEKDTTLPVDQDTAPQDQGSAVPYTSTAGLLEE